jgi:hypothetical protein
MRAEAMRDIKESDCKRLRDLKALALERFCDRVLLDIDRARSDATATPQQRYLAIYALIEKRDKELGDIFNDLKRSNALLKALLIQRAGLSTEDELAGFSEETKSPIAMLQGD